MKLKSARIKHFKRFVDLTIRNLPSRAPRRNSRPRLARQATGTATPIPHRTMHPTPISAHHSRDPLGVLSTVGGNDVEALAVNSGASGDTG